MSDFFEYLKKREPLLYLLKDDLQKKENDLHDNQKKSIVIKSLKQSAQKDSIEKVYEQTTKKEQQIKDIEKKNLEHFLDKYKGLKAFKVDYKKIEHNKKNEKMEPSSYFITFIINVLAMIAFTTEILGTSYANQYFLHRFILNQTLEPSLSNL